jgi:hypothetical protein
LRSFKFLAYTERGRAGPLGATGSRKRARCCISPPSTNRNLFYLFPVVLAAPPEKFVEFVFVLAVGARRSQRAVAPLTGESRQRRRTCCVRGRRGPRTSPPRGRLIAGYDTRRVYASRFMNGQRVQ